MSQVNQAGQGNIGAYGTFVGYSGSITMCESVGDKWIHKLSTSNLSGSKSQ